jgi:hypothetical protein
MIKILTLVLIHVGLIYQPVDYEQKPMDYFCSHILPEHMPKLRKISFSGRTDTAATRFGLMPVCFEVGKTLKISLEQSAMKSGQAIPVNVCNCKGVKFIHGSAKARVYVLRDTKVGNLHYVAIEMHVRHTNTYSYFIEMNEDGKVLKWCRSELIH